LRNLWRSQSLRAHITLVATLLFGVTVAAGALLLIGLLRMSLLHEIDSSASKAGAGIAGLLREGKQPTILTGISGVDQAQVLDADGQVVAHAALTDAYVPLLSGEQLARARAGHRIDLDGVAGLLGEKVRVTAVPAVNGQTVLVASGLGAVQRAVRLLRLAALTGGPIAVLAMGSATYAIVARTLRPVAALRRGAEQITAAGLAEHRLPVSDAQDELRRLAVTLNAMLDRIDTATQRQRTFVGDAAHELRSPLASLRTQLEVAGRVGPPGDLTAFLDDALADVTRLDRLVEDLLALARSDESGGALRRSEPVELDALAGAVLAGYVTARVPVSARVAPVIVEGDPEALRRIMVNLVDNAVRYAKSQVAVTIEQSRRGRGQATAQLVVADDGPGVPASERERVFDRFYRVAPSRSRETGGTGLGLAIVRDLATAHGGQVRLAGNHPGLRVTVTLPAVTAAPQ